MKQLYGLALAIAVLPASASERPEDPIVWKCYMCTPEERKAVATSKGEGEHLVYNAQFWDAIYAYRVTLQDGRLVAEEYTPHWWITTQHRWFMSTFNTDRGEFVSGYDRVNLNAPDSANGRSDVKLWGHHLSALNPVSAEGRKIAQRAITSWMSNAIGTDLEHGRILRYEFQLDGSAPLVTRLNFLTEGLGSVEYYLDRETRTWQFLASRETGNPIQESADDFLMPDGSPRRFRYTWYRENHTYFLDRARWAGVTVVGTVPSKGDITFDCEKAVNGIQCYVY